MPVAAGIYQGGECDHCGQALPFPELKPVIRKGYQSYQGALWPMNEEKRTWLCAQCYTVLQESAAVHVEDDDEPRS